MTNEITTDIDKIKKILERGVENVFVKEKLEQKLISGQKLRVYLGIDPTGPTLHMGHTIPLMKLRQFQELGHEVILLMGDFTAMIGDPTDKLATRKQLARQDVLTNLKKYKRQASKFLKFTGPNKALFKFNSKWLSKMKFGDVLDLASKMTVDQMLKRDMFVRRSEEGKPIFIHEFMYPLMQGYDSVAMDVDVEVGGNDQTFNMLAGRHLVSSILNKDKSVIAMKLLEDNTGKKMGKTEGNMVSFEDSPSEMFGKVMSWNDSLIGIGFELCTTVSVEEIKSFTDNLSSGVNPRDIKMKLAQEIVKMYHSQKKAKDAEKNFIQTFQKKEIPDVLEQVKIKSGERLMDSMVEKQIVESKGEFRRLVEGGAITDLETGEKIIDPNHVLVMSQKIKIGKRRFVEITVE
jgi:tyrosyl-tRNA synthetase